MREFNPSAQTNITSIFVNVRTWRDSYGNTYHAGVLVATYSEPDSGRACQAVKSLPVTYGGGREWENTAARLLAEDSPAWDASTNLRWECKRHGVSLVVMEEQVTSRSKLAPAIDFGG